MALPDVNVPWPKKLRTSLPPLTGPGEEFVSGPEVPTHWTLPRTAAPATAPPRYPVPGVETTRGISFLALAVSVNPTGGGWLSETVRGRQLV